MTFFNIQQHNINLIPFRLHSNNLWKLQIKCRQRFLLPTNLHRIWRKTSIWLSSRTQRWWPARSREDAEPKKISYQRSLAVEWRGRRRRKRWSRRVHLRLLRRVIRVFRMDDEARSWQSPSGGWGKLKGGGVWVLDVWKVFQITSDLRRSPKKPFQQIHEDNFEKARLRHLRKMVWDSFQARAAHERTPRHPRPRRPPTTAAQGIQVGIWILSDNFCASFFAGNCFSLKSISYFLAYFHEFWVTIQKTFLLFDSKNKFEIFNTSVFFSSKEALKPCNWFSTDPIEQPFRFLSFWMLKQDCLAST